MSILEEVKRDKALNNDDAVIKENHYDFLIQQAELVKILKNRNEELEYASKYNGELNEFLQKRKLPPDTIGRHVVDVAMDYVEELEEENRTLKEFQKQWHENMFGKENISE